MINAAAEGATLCVPQANRGPSGGDCVVLLQLSVISCLESKLKNKKNKDLLCAIVCCTWMTTAFAHLK